MRRSSSIFASVCLSILVGLVGCGGSSSSGDGTTSGDSAPGGDSTIDASGLGDSISTGDSSGKTDSSTIDESSITPDTSTPPGDGGLSCGSTTCASGEVCCAAAGDGGASFTCATSCPDSSATISCDGPDKCSTSAKYCCAKINVTGTFPSCSFGSGEAACKSDCPTTLPAGCPGTGQAKLCKKAADCADDASNKNCCTFSGGGGTANFCVPDLAKSFSTGCL